MVWDPMCGHAFIFETIFEPSSCSSACIIFANFCRISSLFMSLLCEAALLLVMFRFSKLVFCLRDACVCEGVCIRCGPLICSLKWDLLRALGDHFGILWGSIWGPIWVTLVTDLGHFGDRFGTLCGTDLGHFGERFGTLRGSKSGRKFLVRVSLGSFFTWSA